MDTLDKLAILGAAAKYDVCASSGVKPGRLPATQDRIGSVAAGGICHSFLPDGRCISLFRVLQTNVCHCDCAYCPNRRSSDIQRSSFAPDELANLFMEFYRRNYVEGVFLSSGTGGDVENTMSQMISTAELLRAKHRFTGYIHMKILPGSSRGVIDRAAQLADRLSLNLEAPNAERMKALTVVKDYETGLMARLRYLNVLTKRELIPAGYTTQFVVGAAGESDRELLTATTHLYKNVGLKRAYFSAFFPVAGTPLEGLRPAPLVREHRLYQCDFLMRFYGYSMQDFWFNEAGNLPPGVDPKILTALMRPQDYPVDPNRASKDQLLRVPGIGPTSVRRILQVRRESRIGSLDQLKRMGVVVSRARYFLLVNGRRQGDPDNLAQKLIVPEQLRFDVRGGDLLAGALSGGLYLPDAGGIAGALPRT